MKKQKKGETSTQKAIETETGTLAEGNITYQQIQIPGDPNWVDIVSLEKVQAIFENPDTIVSQVTTTIVESEVVVSSKGPIGDSRE
jgi:hypothetical protein